MFDLRRSDVVLLQAVADHGSLHAVERDGRMTQSSASRRLVKLERRLRTPLVSRGATGTEPTEAGHALLHVGRRLLASIDFAIATTHHGADAASRLPVVEFAVGTEWAYGLDEHLAGRFPDVVFDIVPDDSHRIWQRFERYAADAALGWETARRPMARRGGVLIRTVAEEPQQIALPSGHPLAERGILDLRDLTRTEWVAVVGGDSGDDQGWALSRLTPVLSVSFTVRSQGAALDLVRRGYGIALVSPSSLGGSAGPGVVLRPLRQKFVRRLRLAVDPLAIPEPLAEDLCALLRRRYMLRTTAHGAVPAGTRRDQDPDGGNRAAPAAGGCAVPPPVLLSELRWSSPDRCGGFEPEHLHLLRVISRTGSLNRAASALLVTQPALTRRIHRLEASCGLPLVHSTARGTSLSATARRLLACTGPAEHRLDALVNHLRESGPAAVPAAGRPPAESTAGPAPSPVSARTAPR
ncbi:LysR family transcriptional regulator [Streptomyces sp. NBC_01185]|uniref:LysR family transcriptional regulator n=1 Tax=Streptomyces sp. NBC_01185 TaxID=2903764 RepID=UPI00386AFF7E|nr:LysR family transcriptional regulator [Streptomyces sp. NBC_01185]